MAKAPPIKSTTDYKLFESQNADNRPLNEKKHRKLRDSLKEYGHLPYWPIVVHRNGLGKLKVDDGQHRLHFAKKMGLPVYYIESHHDFDIATINTTQSVWSLKDYVDKHSLNGVEDYTEAIEFSCKHHIPLGKSLALLAGTINISNIRSDVEDGSFEVTDRPYADLVAMTYSPIAALSRKVRNDHFLGACMAVCRVEAFDPSRLVQGASKSVDRLESFSTRDAYLEMIEDLYNYRRKAKKLPLRFLANEIMEARNSARKAASREASK